MKFRATDTVTKGRLPNISGLIAEYLASNEGKEVDVNISLTDIRTSPQNRMYWGLIIPQFQKLFKEQWGETLGTDALHNLLKDNSITLKDTIVNDDKVVTYSRGTSDLDIKEFQDFVSELDMLAFDYFGCNLTLPDDLINLKI